MPVRCGPGNDSDAVIIINRLAWDPGGFLFVFVFFVDSARSARSYDRTIDGFPRES